MFGIFNREAPRYRGTSATSSGGEGILGALSRLLGSAKPEYRGLGQPTATSGWFGWYTERPVYRTPAPSAPAAEPATNAPRESTPNGAPAAVAASESPTRPATALPDSVSVADAVTDLEVDPESEVESGGMDAAELSPLELEPVLVAEDEPASAGNGEGLPRPECGDPLFARGPVTILIRRSPQCRENE